MAEGRRTNGAEALPADALKDAGQRLVGVLVQRSAEAATQRVNGLTVRLSAVTESGGDVRAGLRGKSQGEGRDGRAGGLRETWHRVWRRALSGLQEKVQHLFGSGGGAAELTRINLLEGVEVGLPLRTTYDAWTQFAAFPSFNRVESVGPVPDQRTKWTAKLLRSRGPQDTTIVEQVPDSRIVWRSAGAQGHMDGAVGFTPLGSDRTQVLLVLEWPKGPFARTGNVWPARARPVRLDLEQFHRRAVAQVLVHQKRVQGWRGEIRGSEVVTTHEQACEQERESHEESGPEEVTDQQDVSAREGIAKDEPAADAVDGDYVAVDQGEQDQVGEEEQVVEDEPRSVGSGRRR